MSMITSMTPRSAKDKGRRWENEVCQAYKAAGALHTERRRLQGSQDRGDVTGIPGVVTECKNERSYDPAGWRKELVVEMANDEAEIGAVWFRLNGKPEAMDGCILTTPDVWLTLLRKAGYLPEQM